MLLSGRITKGTEECLYYVVLYSLRMEVGKFTQKYEDEENRPKKCMLVIPWIENSKSR